MRIIFTGGGTLGSVTPLIAVYEEFAGSAQAMWVGTRSGPEKELVRGYHMPFRSIFSGKFRRYFSVRNFLDPFLLCIGIVQAFRIILTFQPDIIVGAGGYVSVPVMWAGWLLKKKILILQLDIQPSLANIMTRFCARGVALACDDQKKYFQGGKTVVTGIPVRKKIVELAGKIRDSKNRISLRVLLGIPDDNLPVVLIVGGGTGAEFINIRVLESLGELTKICHVVHITGKGKGGVAVVSYIQERYHVFEFLGEKLLDYIAISDCVVTRAGMGMLSELSVYGKPTIIIPIPHSHQEKNAVYFERQKHAAIYLLQEGLTAEKFIETIRRIFKDSVLMQELSDHVRLALPQDGARRVRELVEEIVKNR